MKKQTRGKPKAGQAAKTDLQIGQLLGKLKDYAPGDLIGALEIIELSEQIQKDKRLDRDSAGLLSRIKGEVEKIFKQEDTPDGYQRLQALIPQLEHAGEGEKTPRPEQEQEKQTSGKKAAGKQSSLAGSIGMDDREVLQSFIQEAHEHLDNIEEKMLSLEKDPSPELVNEIFRSMHTIKGTSSFLGLATINNLSHSLESALEDLRSGNIRVTPDLVDVLLEGTDLVCSLIRNLEKAVREHKGGKEIPIPDSDLDISPINDKLQKVVVDSSLAAAEKPKAAAQEELISQEMIDRFAAESSDLLDNAESDILELEGKPNAKKILDEIFRSIHTVKGNAGFLGFSKVEGICMEMESLLDTLRRGDRQVDNQVVTLLLNTIDGLRRNLGTLEEGAEPGETGSATEKSATGAGMGEKSKPLGEILVDMGETSQEDVEQALAMQEMKVGELLVSEGKVSEAALEQALKTQGAPVPGDDISAYTTERKDIRVDMSKLDRLFDLMGELITAEAMVINHPELTELDLEGFERAASQLSKITREIQEITMTIRMIPLEGLFGKMRRLVRDLSRKFGKRVNLMISGQETEMDRNVTEVIADPLVHIIRNAVDHGIETQKQRQKQGKPEMGTIFLNARYEGNEIWIEVRDDGAGLNRQKILKKAQEKGLVKSDPADLEDEEVWRLIFEPGFSTAVEVSEISGRGVGMDVVRRNIEKLRGKIDLHSAPGQGSTITLKIPITLAIIDGITARVGSTLYALPIDDILEFHKPAEEQITHTKSDRQVLRLRESIIPLIKLYKFFHINTEKKEITEGITIIVQANGVKAGLLVDEITGYQQIVVKALPEYLGNMRAISGCSLMSNGEVSLIIDTGSLIKEELE